MPALDAVLPLPPSGFAPDARPDTEFEAALLTSMLQELPEYVFFKDRDSRFLAVSDSLVRALGCRDVSEVLGRSEADFFPPAHAARTREAELQVMATGHGLHEQVHHERWPDGKTTWVVTSTAPLRDDEGRIVGTFGLTRDISEHKQSELELEKAHRDLVDASRLAGMAEVATGVLHNVGNVLNSLNVSASVLANGLRQSKADSLGRISALIDEHARDLGRFLADDPRGRRVPEFISSVAQHTSEERDRLLGELASLQKNIDHIKEIVAMQQAYATMVGVVEALDPVLLMEDALRMNLSSLESNDVTVERDFAPVPKVGGEQAKVLQILVNLISNAKNACDESTNRPKLIRLGVQRRDDRIQLSVRDNGIGIAPENLTRIFQHGFTTRVKGHGFGLHSAAIAAQEMRGSVQVHSEGLGCGSTFTLDLPIAAAAVAP